MMSAFKAISPGPFPIFHWFFRPSFSVVAARFAFYSRWLIYKFMSSTARGVIALKCFAVPTVIFLVFPAALFRPLCYTEKYISYILKRQKKNIFIPFFVIYFTYVYKIKKII